MDPLVEPGRELGAGEIARYRRHLTLPQIGIDGQRRLTAARVLVVGAGGLGSPALQYLAAAGIGTLGIVDHDAVEESNLHRQIIHGTADVGSPKTRSASDAVGALNPDVNVVEHRLRLTPDNAVDLLRGYHLVLDGSDNFATRYALADAAERLALPVVWAAILRFEGQLSVFWHRHGPLYRDLYPAAPDPGTVPTCAEAGVLGVLPGVIGTLMATEAIKLITGIGDPLIGRLLTYDALTATFRTLQLDDANLEGRSRTTPAHTHQYDADSIDAAALTALLDSGAPLTVLDLRTSSERDFGVVPGAHPVDLDALIHDGIDALPATAHDGDVVFYCQSGARSALAVAALRARPGDRSGTVRHLAGGYSAWTRR